MIIGLQFAKRLNGNEGFAIFKFYYFGGNAFRSCNTLFTLIKLRLLGTGALTSHTRIPERWPGLIIVRFTQESGKLIKGCLPIGQVDGPCDLLNVIETNLSERNELAVFLHILQFME